MNFRLPALLAVLILAGCVSAPTAPSVMVLPGSGRSFESFRADEAQCRDYAYMQTGGTSAQQSGQQAAVASAAVGTAVGAAAGAAFGGREGAAVGAGTGLLFGSAVGAENARHSEIGTQRQYDIAYIQCMYTKGHRVPAPPGMMSSPPPVAPGIVPPAGPPPPPPPRY